MAYGELANSPVSRRDTLLTRQIQTAGITDDLSGIPEKGDYYDQDSGLNGRKCVDVTDRPTNIPGIRFVYALYQGYNALA